MELSLGKHPRVGASEMSLSPPNYFVNYKLVGRCHDVALYTASIGFHIVVLNFNGCPSV